MLVQSKLQGWIASGVELSPYAAQIAAETSRVPVSSGTLEEACFPDAQFDVITMMDVIEHLAVPRRTIQECYRILAPGGVLCFVTPNFRSACVRFMRNRAHGIWPDAHLVYFTKDGARKMLSSIGFSRIEIGTRDIYAQNIALLLGKDNKSNVIRNSFAARPAQALLRRAVNAVLWRLPIGDKLVALARKPAY
jgi:2-polyprenyl-3-methyl-5-hydroxy-6-metoxy-1,4-benzoquinol methylase